METKNHLALPLKYRPMTFQDVVGQEHVTRTLRHAIETNHVANAYLFVGSRGIGKTTLSRIFAKALNCLHPNGADPCGECENCRQIAEGRAMDVVEIDGASHNKVEDARSIIDAVQFPPAAGKYKVFIIDEVHMLTPSAFNALLKTLEEPPSYARFIFATTEGDKVLPTIVSRCQRFDLHRIQTQQIVERLKKICALENVEASENALLAIARGAEGGMRDALSSLDQLMAFKGGSISEEDALGVFGLVSRKSLEDLASAMLSGDTATILRSIDVFDSAGKNMRRLSGELLAHFRNLIVVNALGDAAQNTVEATQDQFATLKKQAEGIDPGRLFKIADILVSLDDKLRYALNVRTLIELSLIRASRAATTASIEEIYRALRALRGTQVASESSSAVHRPAPPQTPEAGSVRETALKAAMESPRRAAASSGVSPLDSLPPLPGAPAPARQDNPPDDGVGQPKSDDTAPALTRREILDDPSLNDLLGALPGAQITAIS